MLPFCLKPANKPRRMGLHYKDRDGQVLLEQEQKIIFSVLNMLMDMEHIICLYERGWSTQCFKLMLSMW